MLLSVDPREARRQCSVPVGSLQQPLEIEPVELGRHLPVRPLRRPRAPGGADHRLRDGIAFLAGNILD